MTKRYVNYFIRIFSKLHYATLIWSSNINKQRTFYSNSKKIFLDFSIEIYQQYAQWNSKIEEKKRRFQDDDWSRLPSPLRNSKITIVPRDFKINSSTLVDVTQSWKSGTRGPQPGTRNFDLPFLLSPAWIDLPEFEYTYSMLQKLSEKSSRASNAHRKKQKGRNENTCKYRRISTFRNYKIFIREIDITYLEILNASCGCLWKIKSLWSQIIKIWSLSRNSFHLKYRNECYTLSIRYIFAFYIKYCQIFRKCIKIHKINAIY